MTKTSTIHHQKNDVMIMPRGKMDENRFKDQKEVYAKNTKNFHFGANSLDMK